MGEVNDMAALLASGRDGCGGAAKPLWGRHPAHSDRSSGMSVPDPRPRYRQGARNCCGWKTGLLTRQPDFEGLLMAMTALFALSAEEKTRMSHTVHDLARLYFDLEDVTSTYRPSWRNTGPDHVAGLCTLS